MNVTIKVATLYDCDSLPQDHGGFNNTFNPMWMQTVTGCKILTILRDMYKFNMSYVYDNPERNVTIIGDYLNMSHNANNDVDVYARSMSLTSYLLDEVYPVLAINTWRFGFLLSRKTHFFNTFYSKTFTRPAWFCLFVMAFFISIIFYLLKRWEFSVMGGCQYSFVYEFLMVIGSYCQHIPPVDSKLLSRRIAYFVFAFFTYIVYTYYASNLLSNLVNDKAHNIDLKGLAESEYKCVMVDYMMLAISEHSLMYSHNRSVILNKLLALPSVTVPNGLDAVKKGEVALLSDYTTIYPYIKKTYNNNEICKLTSVDLYSNIKKYIYTSKSFQYKEQFKIGTLRIKEAGILNRIVSTDFAESICAPSHLVRISLKQTTILLTQLACLYVAAVLILVAERIYYKRNTVWPYVE